MSERKLAEQFDISHSTVRRVLDELAAEGLIYKVHGKGTFVAPPREVRQLPTVIYADTVEFAEHPFFASRLNGMMVAAAQLGLRLEVRHCDQHRKWASELLAEVAREQVRGLVLPLVTESMLRRMRAINPELAIVVTAWACPPLGVNTIGVDYASIGKCGVDYLISRGARRPVVVTVHEATLVGLAAFPGKSDVEPLVVRVESMSRPDAAAIGRRLEELAGDGLVFDDDHVARVVLAGLGPVGLPVVSHANAGNRALPPSVARLEVDGDALGRQLIRLLQAHIANSQLPSVCTLARPTLRRPADEN